MSKFKKKQPAVQSKIKTKIDKAYDGFNSKYLIEEEEEEQESNWESYLDLKRNKYSSDDSYYENY